MTKKKEKSYRVCVLLAFSRKISEDLYTILSISKILEIFIKATHRYTGFAHN